MTMVGQALPYQRRQPAQHVEALAPAQWRRSGLVLLAAVAIATAFAMLLISAAIFDADPGPCADASHSESCCIASSLDAFAVDACRDLQ
jgi:hypothetical protein